VELCESNNIWNFGHETTVDRYEWSASYSSRRHLQENSSSRCNPIRGLYPFLAHWTQVHA